MIASHPRAKGQSGQSDPSARRRPARSCLGVRAATASCLIARQVRGALPVGRHLQSDQGLNPTRYPGSAMGRSLHATFRRKPFFRAYEFLVPRRKKRSSALPAERNGHQASIFFSRRPWHRDHARKVSSRAMRQRSVVCQLRITTTNRAAKGQMGKCKGPSWQTGALKGQSGE